MEDSLDEFAKVIGEQTFLDLSKVKSLEQQVDSLNSAIQSVLPNLKSNKDFDIVLSYSQTGIPTISVYVDSSQEQIPDLGILNRKGLFELLARINAKKQPRLQNLIPPTQLKPNPRENIDKEEHKKIDSSDNQLLLDQDGKVVLDDELQTVTDHPVIINSYSHEKRLIFASTSPHLGQKIHQFKFVTDSLTDIDYAGIACAQNIECKVSFSYKSKIPKQQMNYNEIKFPPNIIDLSKILNKLKYLKECDQIKAIQSIFGVLENF
ncbi:hypothetical protein JCM30760_22480 [Thiomicrorhabdus hydrogeniphila]